MRYVAILILLVIVCCSTKNDTQTQAHESPEKPEQDSVLFQRDTTLSFSAKGESDTFRMIVTGKSLKEGKGTFQIMNQKGQTIHSENFETNMLLDYAFDGNAEKSEAETHIRYRLESFFTPDKFRIPAIATSTVFDKNYSDKEIWDDIQADQSAVGFTYLLGKEDKRYIAFSQKQNKVVMYYNCC
jgi:hypothetical protein